MYLGRFGFDFKIGRDFMGRVLKCFHSELWGGSSSLSGFVYSALRCRGILERSGCLLSEWRGSILQILGWVGIISGLTPPLVLGFSTFMFESYNQNKGKALLIERSVEEGGVAIFTAHDSGTSGASISLSQRPSVWR